MTKIERDKELKEIFLFKRALTNKINFNKKLIQKCDNYENKELAVTFRKLVTIQIAECAKLALPKIAKELGVSFVFVKREWLHFIKRETNQGLSFFQQQKILKAIEQSRLRDLKSIKL
jgi:hypothetical protein